MARKNRVWYPGAIYHVISRGNRKEDIFRNDADYSYFLDQLRDTQKQFPFLVHALCMMTNHFHIQMETVDIAPGKIMNKCLSNYASHFNYKYSLSGHVFQERYTSSLIESDAYFLEVNRYIHLNPVRAKIVKNPLDYEYSSYSLFVSDEQEWGHSRIIRQQMKDIVDTSRILDAFGNDRKRYKMFIEGDSPR